jgi:hypothetical protein
MPALARLRTELSALASCSFAFAFAFLLVLVLVLAFDSSDLVHGTEFIDVRCLFFRPELS